MKVAIIGAGKVGTEIAGKLSEEGHDIVVIDHKEAQLQKIEEKFDCLTIKGKGPSSSILKSPTVADSQLLVSVTDSDEVNMISCMTAKRIGISRTIARIRDPEYHQELVISKKDLGIDLVINPEWAAAEEINRLLSIALPIHAEPLARGKVQLVDFTVDENSTTFARKRLSQLELPPSCLVVAISRGGNMIIPGGPDIILPGDIVYIMGLPENINKLCIKSKKKKQKIQKVMILGGGRIGYYLAKRLCSRGMNVKIIEQDPGKCSELAERLPTALVIEGDGSDLEILKKEGIKETDAFIAVTGLDEENLLISLLSKQLGAKRVVAKISRSGYAPLVERLGVDSAISPRLITVGEILRFIRGGRLLSLVLLLNEKAEVIELMVQPQSKIVGRYLKKSNLPKRTIIGSIIRNGKTIIPKGSDMILEGDRLVIFTMDQNIKAIENLCGLEGRSLEHTSDFENIGYSASM
ncbi:MAG: Trk system potassium transporter TrkA [Clostridiales bacterium]|nr:Trk system potassium transporter TrkA [Clostridiales bacterium]MCF8021342.1 Trk system potassium transporter TrkA [Clostridiales bacterium]